MNDKEIEKLLRSIESDVPPDELKDRVFERIIAQKDCHAASFMAGLERVIFERPFIAACALSIPISGFLWAIMGEDYMDIMSNIIRPW